jgi:hypothetical protein
MLMQRHVAEEKARLAQRKLDAAGTAQAGKPIRLPAEAEKELSKDRKMYQAIRAMQQLQALPEGKSSFADSLGASLGLGTEAGRTRKELFEHFALQELGGEVGNALQKEEMRIFGRKQANWNNYLTSTPDELEAYAKFAKNKYESYVNSLKIRKFIRPDEEAAFALPEMRQVYGGEDQADDNAPYGIPGASVGKGAR